MTSDDSASAQKQPLTRNPSVWLIVPTLSLLLGQAVAATPWMLSLSYLAVFFLPLLFLWRRQHRRWACLVLLAGLSFSLGYVRHRQILHPVFAPSHLRSVMSEGAQIYLEGVLRQEPERLPNRSRWVVSSERIWHPTGSQEITGELLVGVRNARREWRYNDRVRFWVRPLIPRDSGNPGGFDYPSYLARREIYVTGFLENDDGVDLLARRNQGLWGSIEYLRREIRRFIDRHFSQDNGALMKALVVGDMGGISKEIRANFTAAGVNHVLSISGLHVGMLGLVVFWLIRFGCSFSATLLLHWNLLKVATFFSFLAVLFYTALAGAMVPTVRSAIMIGVYELAVLLDREEELFSSLAFAALLIGLAWPGVIMDISFQLSFLAVLFIIWGLRKIQQWMPARQRDELPQERGWLQPRLRQLGLYLAVPILATIGTGPMIAYHFGHLSLAGFLSNPIVVPLVGFIIVPVGLLIGFLSFLTPGLALPLVWLADPLLSLTHTVVRSFSRLPLASIAVPIPNVIEVGLLYLVILSLLLLRRRVHIFIVLGGISLGAIGGGLTWWHERWDRKELRITHLSVGHGDAAVVEFPGSKVLLIDAGGTATGEFDLGESIVAPFLRSRKILKVDYLLVSHPRVDHYGGMRTIVEEFAPSELWSGASKGRAARYQELEEVIERYRVKRVLLNSRDPCRSIEQVRLCVLYPPEDKTGDSSVVLRLSFGRVNLLFAGDIEGRDERILLRDKADLSSTILKVPRHGSLASSTEEFVAVVKPKLAIFSVGRRNPFGLPRHEVVSRYVKAGSEVLRTDQDGAITIETDGERARYWTYRSRKRGEFVP
ncbi:MAG: DNA internalization-related competence protein ComEC/Rec2 [Deltaproteobacteria bacterium]|nr:DNA internalization-related competence protein ComEC/Rec2 [Deltaproteobacteria bacterium]